MVAIGRASDTQSQSDDVISGRAPIPSGPSMQPWKSPPATAATPPSKPARKWAFIGGGIAVAVLAAGIYWTVSTAGASQPKTAAPAAAKAANPAAAPAQPAPAAQPTSEQFMRRLGCPRSEQFAPYPVPAQSAFECLKGGSNSGSVYFFTSHNKLAYWLSGLPGTFNYTVVVGPTWIIENPDDDVAVAAMNHGGQPYYAGESPPR